MKREKAREKARELAREVLRQHQGTLMTYRTLEINWIDRTVKIGNRTVKCSDEYPAVVFPIIGTDHVILLPTGERLPGVESEEGYGDV